MNASFENISSTSTEIASSHQIHILGVITGVLVVSILAQSVIILIICVRKKTADRKSGFVESGGITVYYHSQRVPEERDQLISNNDALDMCPQGTDGNSNLPDEFVMRNMRSSSCSSEPYLHRITIRNSDSDYESLNSVSLIKTPRNSCHSFSKKIKQSSDHMLREQSMSFSNPFIPETILKTHWKLKAKIDALGGSLRDDFSDVCLDFPKGSIVNDSGTLVYGAVMTDVASLRSKFRLDNDTVIVAPVPEYYMTIKETLQNHAVIKIPHCLLSQSKQIKVSWFQNDPSLPSGFVMKTVERRDPMEAIDESLDMFYVDDNDGFIRIFTRHFSGILCTACKSKIHFDITGVLYSQFGRYSSSPSLRIKLLLGGPLMKLRAFWEETDNSMRNLGFNKIEQTRIDLLREQSPESSLQFRLNLSGNSFHRWDHVCRTGSTNELIHNVPQTAQISDILECGNEHEVNCNIQWYLVNTSQEEDNVTLFVDVINIQNLQTTEGASETKRTTINAEIDTKSIYQETNQTPSNEGADPLKMAGALYLLIENLSTEKLKKLVRFLGFPEKARSMDGSNEDERNDYWYESLLDISATTGTEFPDVLCKTLEQMREPIENDVRDIFFPSANTINENSIALSSVEPLIYASLTGNSTESVVETDIQPSNTQPKEI